MGRQREDMWAGESLVRFRIAKALHNWAGFSVLV